jgi:hypothetical protein
MTREIVTHAQSRTPSGPHAIELVTGEQDPGRDPGEHMLAARVLFVRVGTIRFVDNLQCQT